MQDALAALGAYLLGSVSFAIVLSRLAGMPDPHSYGSGNPGATNVLRSGRKLVAGLTLVGDGGKGWLAVWLAALLAPGTAAVAALAVFLGHLFPVFHRFRGGKGVATAAGALLGLDWRIGLGSLVTWGVIVFFFRYVSLASLIAAIFAAVFSVLFHGADAPSAGVCAISALLIWRHKDNIRRLLAGQESRLGSKAEPKPRDPSAGAP
jgi:acyl phosphate:glycerol-3-phosphate acyltransferase